MPLVVRLRRDGTISVGSRLLGPLGEPPARHQFSTRWLARAQTDGTATFDGETIVINSQPAVAYRVERCPGAYCLYCGAEIGEAGLSHVKNCDAYEGENDHSRGFYEVADYYQGERV